MDRSRRRAMAALSAVALAGLAACASEPARKQAGGEEYLDDATTTAKVKTAIATDAGARTAAAVNVETYRGVVQLTGFIDSQDQGQRAVEAARKVAGVRSVKNDLRVK